MSFKPGEKLSVARLNRLTSSIPTSYTVFKDGSTYYAECNLPGGGTPYSGTNASTVIQSAIDATTRGKIVVRSDVLLTSEIDMKRDVHVELQSKVTINSDIYGFNFDAIQYSSLVGGEISVTATAYTKAAIKLTGVLCVKNRISNMVIELPVGLGYGLQLRAGLNQSVYANEFEDIEIIHGKRGIQVELTLGGWCNVNKFNNVWLIEPSEYGFAVVNNGLSYSGNYHAFVWTEINADNVSAFYFEGAGTTIHDNTYLACKGVDYGETNSYFAVLAAASTPPSGNLWIGCQGSSNLENKNDFLYDVWIDYGNWKTQLFYGDNATLVQLLKCEKPDVNMLLQLWGSHDPTDRTAISFQNRTTDAMETLEMGAYGTAYKLEIWKDAAGTLRPFLFRVNENSVVTEIARIDTDKNFKFTNLSIPAAAPTTPVAGSTYFNSATDTLYVYNGAAWKSVALT